MTRRTKVDFAAAAEGLSRAVSLGGGPVAGAFLLTAGRIARDWLPDFPTGVWQLLLRLVGAWDDPTALGQALELMGAVREKLATFVAGGGLRGHGAEPLLDGWTHYLVFTVVTAAVYRAIVRRVSELGGMPAGTAATAGAPPATVDTPAAA